MAGAGSGECGWIRVVIVVEDVLAGVVCVPNGDDEEMEEQDRHNRRGAPRKRWKYFAADK